MIILYPASIRVTSISDSQLTDQNPANAISGEVHNTRLPGCRIPWPPL